ncbi:MAG TPA: SMP-30/gluconolactonase/LRE family protein [Cytophagaceae bacterium]|nr:SMP-30/gluconolactonase/LRE family protein [Cytophagaceae bacterium]
MNFTKPQLLAKDLGFAESPLWHPEGYLLLSDVQKNRILKWQDKKLSVFLEESGWKGALTEQHSDQPGANGLALDAYGNLVFCQHGSYAIAQLKPNREVETIIDHYEGKRLNSPNDLCIAPDGSIYFTDPPYGIKDKKLQPSFAQRLAGVYRWYKNELTLLTDDFNYPNGICFSPDYKYLYIGSADEREQRVRRYQLSNGQLKSGVTFTKINADGIKTDSEGNVYLATQKGIKILSSNGEEKYLIPLPDPATNLCFHKDKIYITTPSKLYECYRF